MINKARIGKKASGSSEMARPAGRHGNGVQTNDGRSQLGRDESSQPKDTGSGSGSVASED